MTLDDLRTKAQAPDAKLEDHRVLAKALGEAVSELESSGDLLGAIPLAEEAVAERTRVREGIERLRSTPPFDHLLPEAEAREVLALGRLAKAFAKTNDQASAAQHARAAVVIAERSASDRLDDTLRRAVGASLSDSGRLLMGDDARRAFVASLACLRTFDSNQDPALRRMLGIALHHLAMAEHETGYHDDEGLHVEEAVHVLAALAATVPNDATDIQLFRAEMTRCSSFEERGLDERAHDVATWLDRQADALEPRFAAAGRDADLTTLRAWASHRGG